jgi:hypothetical protein
LHTTSTGRTFTTLRLRPSNPACRRRTLVPNRSTSPLLFYTHFIHDAKVPSKKGPGLVKNLNIAELREHFTKGTEAGDKEFLRLLRLLMLDIRKNMFIAIGNGLDGHKQIDERPDLTIPFNAD